MDSVTQFALGAGVGAVVLGPKIGARKAVLAGGVLGTLPDLDVFFPYDNPVDSFTLHRGASHSLLVHAAVTPILGEAVRLIFAELRDRRMLAWLGVYLCLATHALLDALTIYGTQLFWPLWKAPVGIGSVFIIDPLYTVPLLVALAWALCLSGWSPRFARVLGGALIVSTAYLGWTLAAQQIVRGKLAALVADGSPLLVTTTPFNSFLWKAVAFDRDHYFNIYLPVWAPAESAEIYRHVRRPRGLVCPEGMEMFDRLAGFSKGFYRLERVGDDVVLSDLRMGMTPNYVFRFRIARFNGVELRAVPPLRLASPRSSSGDLDWLFARLGGAVRTRPAETASAARLADLTGRRTPRVAAC